jgi:hypothetical protein
MKRHIIFAVVMLFAAVGFAQKDVTAQYITNATLSNGTTGWTNTNFNTPVSGNGTIRINNIDYKSYNTIGFASECYAGWGSLEKTNYSLTQTITLPAGHYTLVNYSFFRYGLNAETDTTKSLAYLKAGSSQVAIKTLGSIIASGYANSQAEGAVAFDSKMYRNALDFTVVTDNTPIEIGLVGTFDLRQSWMIAGKFELIDNDTEATMDAPFDVTGYITNAGFEYRDMSGWTQMPANYLSTQINDQGFKTGLYYAERWQASGALPEGSMSQTIRNLPAGYYKLTANLGGNGTYIDLNGKRANWTSDKDYTVGYVLSENENLTITAGKTAEGTANWIHFDNFRLQFCGDVQEALTTLCGQVSNYQDLLPAAAYSQLQSDVADYNHSYSDVEELLDAISAVQALYENADALLVLVEDLNANIANAQAIDPTHLTTAQQSALSNAISAANSAATASDIEAANTALNDAIAAANTQIANFNTAFDQLENALLRFEKDYNQQVGDGTDYGRLSMSEGAWDDLLAAVNNVTTAMDEPVDYSTFATVAQALNDQLDATDASIRLFKSYQSMIQGCQSLGLTTATYETDTYTENDTKVEEAITALNTLFAEYAATQNSDFSVAGFLGDNLDFSAEPGDYLAGSGFPNLKQISGWTVNYNGLSNGSEWIYVNRNSDDADHNTYLYIRKNWYSSPVTLQALKEAMLPVGSYTLTYWINSNGQNIANNLCYYNLDGTQISLASSDGRWKQVTKSIEVTDEPQPFDLSFGFVTSGSDNAAAQILIDDITLTYNAVSQFQIALNAAREHASSIAAASAIDQWEDYEGHEENFASAIERQRAINILNNAVTIAQNDGNATSLITNADFKGATASISTQGGGGQVIYPSGWTFTRTYNGWNDTNVDTSQGVFNAWAGTITLAELYQTLSDLPNGQYRLTADVKTGEGLTEGNSCLAIYGNPTGGLVGRSPEVTGIKDEFSSYSVDFQVVENNFTIGIRSDKAWYQVKNIQLSYVQTDNATAQRDMIQQDYFWKRGDTDVNLTDSKYEEAVGAVLYPQYVNQVIRVDNAQAITLPTKNIVANGVCEQFEITDGNPLAITNGEFTATNATYTRNMTNAFGTLILPYEADATDDVHFFHLTDASGNTANEEGVLQFTSTSHIDANTPVLMKKMNSDATSITITGTNVTVENTTAAQNDGTTCNGWTAQGYYSEEQIEEYSGLFYIASNKFWAATGTLTVKPFRAFYIHEGEGTVNLMGISINDEANAIKSINDDKSVNTGIYNVSGQLVRRTSNTDGLAPGLYIVNGKKTLIK